MNPKNTISLCQAMRRVMALVFSLLLFPAAQLDLHAQTPAPNYVGLDAVQLDQLVAPIALDPDSLVAQILTAATYPDQIAAADTWLNQNMGLPPDQRAAGADGMAWDPAVKGLTAFPSVLDNLAKNTAWTSQLGNAYYNQPGDVMSAIQAMRLQAQQSNTLVTTVQQRVVVDAGVIAIVPVNPAVVYIPYYNPWRVWGTLFASYPGFVVLPPPPGIVVGVGLAFAPVSIGVYADFGWGFSAWAPAWVGGTVLFNHNTYISNSLTVVNHGNFGGHDKGAFEHGGRGVPRGFHATSHAGAARASVGRHSSFGHSASVSHSAHGSHSASASRSASAGHSRSASRSTSAGRSMSSGRSASAGRSMTSGRSTSAGHSMSSGRSASAGRSMSSGRSASAGRSMSSGRSASAGHSMSSGRSASAGRSMSSGRSASAGRSMSSGRSASAGRSMSSGRSASAGRSMSSGRSASAGRSMSSGRSASAARPVSSGRSSGGRASGRKR
jgi:hypothetical protein